LENKQEPKLLNAYSRCSSFLTSKNAANFCTHFFVDPINPI